MSWRIKLKLERSSAFCLDADFSIPSQGCTVLYGPSGCGKTSLLRSVAGLEPDAEGLVSLNDRVLMDSARGIKVPAHQRQLGVVFQGGELFSHLNVQDNLLFASRYGNGTRDSYEEICQLLNVHPLLQRQTNDLSGGETQRVALARALLSQPDALLLDEPLAALDQNSKTQILPYLERLQMSFSRPSLYVTHNLEEAARLGDYLVAMNGGQIICHGPLNEVLADPKSGLVEGSQACSVIKCLVAEKAGEDGLALLKMGSINFWTTSDIPIVGETVRVLIRARDVSLVLSPASDTSILNTLPVRVDNIWSDGQARKIIRLAVCTYDKEAGVAQYLLAAITCRSCDNLNLVPGQELYAQVKSLALL